MKHLKACALILTSTSLGLTLTTSVWWYLQYASPSSDIFKDGIVDWLAIMARGLFPLIISLIFSSEKAVSPFSGSISFPIRTAKQTLFFLGCFVGISGFLSSILSATYAAFYANMYDDSAFEHVLLDTFSDVGLILPMLALGTAIILLAFMVNPEALTIPFRKRGGSSGTHIQGGITKLLKNITFILACIGILGACMQIVISFSNTDYPFIAFLSSLIDLAIAGVLLIFVLILNPPKTILSLKVSKPSMIRMIKYLLFFSGGCYLAAHLLIGITDLLNDLPRDDTSLLSAILSFVSYDKIIGILPIVLAFMISTKRPALLRTKKVDASDHISNSGF